MKTSLILSIALLAACSSSAPSPPPGAVIIALESEPNDLDPRFSTDANSSRIGGLIFAGLVRFDGKGKLVPDLAIAWEQESERSYVFHLRPHLLFHDGSPVQADDVKATYESVLDRKTASPKRETLTPILAIETPNNQTVRFELKQPFAPFLAAAVLGILPKRLARSAHLSYPHLVGAGPFRLASEPQHDHYRLKPFKAYYAGAPKLEALLFKVVPDGVVRCLELSKGKVNFVQNAIEPDTLPWLSRQPNLEIVVSPGTTFHYLGLNLRTPILGDLRVRQALAHAIDRKAIIEHILAGNAALAGGLLSPSHWAYEPSVQTYDADPARAQRLLDLAGYPDPDGRGPKQRLSLTYKTSTVELRRRIGEALQFQFARVGIDLTLRTFEWATFYSDIKRGNFELFSLAWVGINDPDIYYTIFNSQMVPPRGNNRGGYANHEMDLLTLRGQTAINISLRRSIYSQVQKLAARELPYIPLWWENNVVVKDKRIRGFVPRPDGDLIGLKDAYFEIPVTGAQK